MQRIWALSIVLEDPRQGSSPLALILEESNFHFFLDLQTN